MNICCWMTILLSNAQQVASPLSNKYASGLKTTPKYLTFHFIYCHYIFYDFMIEKFSMLSIFTNIFTQTLICQTFLPFIVYSSTLPLPLSPPRNSTGYWKGKSLKGLHCTTCLHYYLLLVNANEWSY